MSQKPVDLRFTDAIGGHLRPAQWLRYWAARFPTEKFEQEHDRLMALPRPLDAAAFERIGRWKDAAHSANRWKANVSSVAYPVWMQAARECPECPVDAEVSAFLEDWSTRSYSEASKTGRRRKRFGLSRATTLLYYLSSGEYPIFDSRVRRAAKRLTGRPMPNKVHAYVSQYLPLFRRVASVCRTSNLRAVDQALFSYGGTDREFARRAVRPPVPESVQRS